MPTESGGRMVPGTPLDIEVEVEHTDGTWHEGLLEHWRQRNGVWRGHVRYHVDVGQQHLGWFDYPNRSGSFAGIVREHLDLYAIRHQPRYSVFTMTDPG